VYIKNAQHITCLWYLIHNAVMKNKIFRHEQLKILLNIGYILQEPILKIKKKRINTDTQKFQKL
jgi:predicted nucleotidyltransferase